MPPSQGMPYIDLGISEVTKSIDGFCHNNRSCLNSANHRNTMAKVVDSSEKFDWFLELV